MWQDNISSVAEATDLALVLAIAVVTFSLSKLVSVYFITHAWTTHYAELPSNKQKRERKQLQSRETVFYMAFVVRYRH